MKKLITTIGSLVLAGTMTFGLAACGGNGGGNSGTGGGGGQTEAQKWAAMVEGLNTIDNYTVTSNDSQSQGLKYKGEYVDEDTVYDGDEMEQMFKQMFVSGMLEEIGGQNPVSQDAISVSYADFANGKFATTSYYDEEKFDYVLVDGTSVKDYSWYVREGSGDPEEFEENESGYYVDEYIGYKNAAQAKAALKENENPLKIMIETEFTGLGDKANVQGTVSEIYELFTYNSSKSAYVARLGTLGIMMVPDGTPVDLEVKVSNGKIVGYNMDVALEMSLADFMGQFMNEDEEGEGGGMPDMSEMLEGLTIEIGILSEMTISNIGSTTINVPEDLDDQVFVYDNGDRAEDVYYVIADENAYKAMFDGLLGDEDTVRFSYGNYPENHTVYYNGELGLLKIVEENYETGEKSAKIYWATEEGLKVYTAVYDDGNFDGWSSPETEAISGNKTEALLSKAPNDVKLYFNLGGKHMSEQFDLFEVRHYNNYQAKITVGETEYGFEIYYNYNENSQKLVFSGYSLYDSDTEDYIYVSVGVGYLQNDDGLPEVEGETVTEDEWKALVEPWYNLKNITITNGYEKTLVDIAADGSSGKIYHISDYTSNSWYITFEKNGDTYAMTKYYFNEGWDYDTQTPTGNWVKVTSQGLSYNDILDAADLEMLKKLGGEVFWDNDTSSLKTIGDMWASVKYNPMTKEYEVEDQWISIAFGQNKLVYNGTTIFSNKGTTVAGELPDEVAEAEDLNEQYAGVYKDTGNDNIVLTLNVDGTFTLEGLDGQPTLEGTWSYEGWGFDFTVTTDGVDIYLSCMDYDESSGTITIGGQYSLSLQKVVD